MWSGDHTTETTTASAEEKKTITNAKNGRKYVKTKRNRKISATLTSQKFV